MDIDSLIRYVQGFQIRYDKFKASLELSRRARKFSELLIYYPTVIHFLFNWKDVLRPIMIFYPSSININNAIANIYRKVRKDKLHYIRNNFYELISQYLNLEHEKIDSVNKFFLQAIDKDVLELFDEVFLYKEIGVNRDVFNLINYDGDIEKLTDYEFAILLAEFKEQIISDIITSHFLENFTLTLFKKFFRDAYPIGMPINGEKQIYTSIQYKGVGPGGSNAEFDLIVAKHDLIIFVECKFNRTTANDVNTFLVASDNFYNRIARIFSNIKYLKLIVSYDGSELEPQERLSVISLKDINTHDELIKTFERAISDKK